MTGRNTRARTGTEPHRQSPGVPPRTVQGKCVLLVDDVLTTGATFIALRRKLIAHGAKFVIGMFLAKTIAFEDERKAEEGG